MTAASGGRLTPLAVGRPSAARARAHRRPRALADAEVDARFFRGLGDPTRLRVVQYLLDGERTVSELGRGLGVRQGRLSSHLMCLRWCGYVTTRRQGKWVYYAVTDPRVRELVGLAQAIRRDHTEALAACAVIGRDRPAEAAE